MSNQIRAGTGKSNITCRSQGTQCELLSEKTRAHIPEEFWDKKIEIDDPLFVRALVLDDGDTRVLQITMDITAVGCRSISQYILNDSADDFMPNLRTRIFDTWGIPGNHVTVNASHTHPPGLLLVDDEKQIDCTMEAIGHALASMEPVTIGVGTGREDRLTVNRTLMLKNGRDHTMRSCFSPVPDEEVEALRPIDPEIGILRIDRLDGTPLAVVYNFASHLLMGTHKYVITADWPGVASQYLEEHIGGDVMALFVQGALGDTQEVAYNDREQPRSCYSFGATMGESTLKAFRRIQPSAPALTVVSTTVEFPLRTDIPDVVAAIRRESDGLMASMRYTSLDFKTFLPLYLKYTLNPEYPSHQPFRYMQADQTGNLEFRAMDERNRLAVDKYLESLATMETMARNEENIATLEKHQEVIDDIGTPTVPAEIQVIRIADSVWITAPMEVLAETGLKIKKESPHEHTFIAAISNGYLHYAPPASYYPRGGYEVTECLLAPEWEEIFETAVRGLLAKV